MTIGWMNRGSGYQAIGPEMTGWKPIPRVDRLEAYPTLVTNPKKKPK
ncbi:hypothetical protein Enr13x_44930 [Stieleria neptunia]|uniref:Uncharacterized protein n=1 Tax=Stieleria neptunia TaxID=2527979 RepID=A0A518HUU1_9BACT|nr:hypothetical protein Enr13x_44930 [Stieleria neptunia]